MKSVFILIFISINYISFAVKIPFINVSKPTSEIIFLSKVSDENYAYAVYPNIGYYSIFWQLYLKKFLINPFNLENKLTDFNSNSFTSELVTPYGIERLKQMEVDYLLYYKSAFSQRKIEQIKKMNSDIDDESDLRLFFESKNYEVTIAENGVEALQKAQEAAQKGSPRMAGERQP